MPSAKASLQRSRNTILVPGLLAVACFLPQTFVLPIFVYSFLALSAAYAWVGLRHAGPAPQDGPQRFRRETPRIVILLTLLLLAVVKTASIASLIFLLTSLSCFVFALLLNTRDWRLKYRATQGFVMACAALLLIGVVWLAVAQPLEGLFQYSLAQGQFRFRALNLEANHLGFALGAAYVVVLFDPQSYFARQQGTRRALILLIWLMSALTLSPFAMATLVLVSVPFLWRSTVGKVVCVSMLGLALLLIGESERVQQILSGEDSSTNFRTWGSLVIGYLQLENCGPLGCGLGNSRDVLADEPLMRAFAAQDILVLPNLLAGAMVEGGYPLLAFALLVVGFASFPPLERGYRASGASVAVFMFLLSFAASGSYPYDAQFWTTTGLLAALVRSGRPPGPRSG
ncbi:MAG: hypothetical protein RLZZ598_891 [Pseudomonadota bacterium]